MIVRAKFDMVFSVTRDVEIDDEDFDRWVVKRYGSDFDRELAMTVWIDGMETDAIAAVFPDFKTTDPLPADFEFQWSECRDAVVAEPSGAAGAGGAS